MGLPRSLIIAGLALHCGFLAGAEVLRGIVQGPEGQPVAGVSIYFVLVPEDSALATEVRLLHESDGAGHFEADVPEPIGLPGAWILFDKAPYAITHHSWGFGWSELANLGSGRDIAVRLGVGSTYNGVLRSQDGAPIVGATVTPLFPSSAPGYETLGTLFPPLDKYFGVATDEKGAFSLGRMPAGLNFGLRIYAPELGWNFAGVTRATSEKRLVLAGEKDIQNLIFASHARVDGVVTEAGTGKPCAGVPVTARSAEAGFTGNFLPPITVETDARGRYRFEALPPGHYYLGATAPGRYSEPVRCEADGPSIFTAPVLRLGEGIRYHGRIVDDDSGAAVSGDKIRLSVRREGVFEPERSPEVKEDGSFEGHAAAGWILLTALSEGLDVVPEDIEKRLILSPAHEHDVTIRVRSHATVDLQVLMPDGSPAAGAVVVDHGARTIHHECDGDGWLRLSFPAFNFADTAGRLALEAYAREDETLRGFASVPYISGKERKNTIALQASASLNGVLIDRQGVIQPGREFYFGHNVMGTGWDIHERVTADNQAHFSVTNLIPGVEYWYHAGGSVTRRVFTPGERAEARVVTTNVDAELLKSLPPDLQSEFSPELKSYLGIDGEKTP